MKQEEILDNLNIDALNAIQLESVAAWRKAKRIVLLAPTGSGKTLAYLLPLVGELTDNPQWRALVLVPSRELAQQTADVVKQMRCGIRAVACYGGRAAMDEHRLLREVNPQLIVATPGRAGDHLRKGNIEGAAVSVLVIDEFDKCLELGFREEMANIVSMLPNVNRRFLLSATDREEIPAFVGAGSTGRNQWGEGDAHEDFVRLDFTDSADDERLHMHAILSPQKDKLQTLLELVCQLGNSQSIVFVNYRESVVRVADFLRKSGVEVSAFHGGMEQRDRERALYRFANGSANVLVSTDLASRGLDIDGVQHIIHYHLPLDDEAFTHRNGRTARWDREGDVWVIVGPEEKVTFKAAELEHTGQLQPPVPRWVTLYIGKGKKDKISKTDVVGFLSKIGGLQRDELGRVDVGDHFAYAAVARTKADAVMRSVRGQKIKGLRTIIERAY